MDVTSLTVEGEVPTLRMGHSKYPIDRFRNRAGPKFGQSLAHAFAITRADGTEVGYFRPSTRDLP